jgi:hypothetical protein
METSVKGYSLAFFADLGSFLKQVSKFCFFSFEMIPFGKALCVVIFNNTKTQKIK